LHLTDTELDEILMGIAEPCASVHLADCATCGERFAAFQSQLDAFNHATMSWSEARANTVSRDIAAHQSTPRMTLKAAWSSVAVAGLAVAFAVGARHSATPAPSPVAHAPMTMPAPEVVQQHEIANDNEMMAAIDSEIVTPQPDRFGLYEPAKTSASTSKSAPKQARD
jgi:hypothetical protein